MHIIDGKRIFRQGLHFLLLGVAEAATVMPV